MARIVFCCNKISLAIGKELVAKKEVKTYLIVMPNRINSAGDPGVYNYNPVVVFLIYLFSLMSSRLEVVVPHAKNDPLTRLIAMHGRNVSLVDDGLDTFRRVPKNIEFNIFKTGIKYYTFEYDIPIAKWLASFLVVRVCSILKLGDGVKRLVDEESVDCLVIESPGVNIDVVSRLCQKALVISHPNYHKSQTLWMGHCVLGGLEVGAEAMAREFPGEIIIGETMVLIYLLSLNHGFSKIHVFLDKIQYDNLQCLHPLFNLCGSCEVAQ